MPPMVLITNHANTHPPESWAATTASMIIDADGNVPAERRIPALRLQAAIAEALISHHAAVQEHEQTNLDGGHSSVPVEDYLGEAIADIQKAAAGTPWEADFADPAMVDRIGSILGDHFATAQHIQGLAHAASKGA